MKKTTDRKILALFILVGIVLFSYLGYKVYNDFFKSRNTHKPIDSIELYEYTLNNNDTSIYKDNFRALSKVLNDKPINYSEYSKLISKLFIIDLYTLNNKMGSTDIGGLEFIHKDLRDNFKDNMGSSLYKFMETNLDGQRKQELPEVKDVEIIDITDTTYTYKDNIYDGYILNAKWTYVKDLGYQNTIKLTIIKEKDILYIVKGE
ncbi:MAG: hypothetical protein IJK67_02450 [Bacilli bacterium]|nr:hypothetical protein [Bacilli bacterium]